MSSRFRVGDSMDHLGRNEVVGRSNADLLVLRKLIEEETCSEAPPADFVRRRVGSGFFGAGGGNHEISQCALDRFVPGQWAAEARRRSAQCPEVANAVCASAPPRPHPPMREVDVLQEGADIQHLHRDAVPEARNTFSGGVCEADTACVKGHAAPCDVTCDTKQQVEAAEESIASSWLSRLFSLGGFKSRLDKNPIADPAVRIPEHTVVHSEAPGHTDDRKEAPALQPTELALDLTPPMVGESQHQPMEKGIVASLGLVLGTKNEGEVIFVRALPNSPAHALLEAEPGKLQENDVLFAVDGDPIYKLPLHTAVEKLSGDLDTVAALHFLRGNREGGDEGKSIVECHCRRIFVTLIRHHAPCEHIGSHEHPIPRPRTSVFDFDVEVEVEEEEAATDRLGRQPRLSELELRPRSSPGAGSHSSRDRMSKEIDEEMKALKARLSSQSRLSLGHSMLRPVENQMDRMAASRLASIRHDEVISLQLRAAAEAARQQYRNLTQAREGLKNEAVGRVREWGEEWGDRERRISAYLGLCERRRPSLLEGTDGAASTEVRAASMQCDTVQLNFGAHLGSMIEEEARTARERDGLVVNNNDEDESDEDGPRLHVPTRTPAKSFGLKALRAERDAERQNLSFEDSVRSNEDDASDEDGPHFQRIELSSRGSKPLPVQPWVVHVMVYEVENLGHSNVPSPYVCLSVLRENPMCSESNGREIRICHNRSKQQRSPHFSSRGDVFQSNVEHKTATKTTRHNASFEEEFRLYSSQSTPSFAEGILDGSDVWLLVSVWAANTDGRDELLGNVALFLSRVSPTPPQVKEEEWRDLLDDAGNRVIGRDGLPSRILVSARYVEGEADASFSTMC